MARLSIGSQHFQAKERRPALSLEQAKVCAPTDTIEAAANAPEAVFGDAMDAQPTEFHQEDDPNQEGDGNREGEGKREGDGNQEIYANQEDGENQESNADQDGDNQESSANQEGDNHRNDSTQGRPTPQHASKYANQNRTLAMRNSELAMKNAELMGVIEHLESQITDLKQELDRKQSLSGFEVDKLVSMLESNQSQVLRYIQTHAREPAHGDKKAFESLSGAVSTSTPNTSKLPIEPPQGLEGSRTEFAKTSSEASHLSDVSFNVRAESTPNTMRESSDESSATCADLAMLDDRSVSDKGALDHSSSKSLIQAEGLENILDSVESEKAPKRPSQSPQESEADPLEYFAKRRALDTRARKFRESKLQPARSVKIEIKSENDQLRSGTIAERKAPRNARKPLSTVSSNVHKKAGKDSSDGIFDFVEKSELLGNKALKRERRP